MSVVSVSILSPDEVSAVHHDLSEILWACVTDGASVGFVLPFDHTAAAAFWNTRVFPSVRTGGTVMFVARIDAKVVGTVQLGLDLLPNQPHRADVAKMLVHPTCQRQGIGRALMQRQEDHARQLGKTLLVLDTRSGDAAQVLYQSLGFLVAGEIPGYCRNPSRDEYEPTTYLYKALGA